MSQIPVERFKDILNIVRNHLVVANVHLTIWEDLRSTPEREKLCDTYDGFFSWTRDAHIDRFINKICVATDRAKNQPSVMKLVNMIQAHPTLACGIAFTQLSQRLDDHKKTISEIRKVRNRRSSHWHLNKSPPEPLIAECRVLLTELNRIIEDIWNAHQPISTGGRHRLSLVPPGHSHTAYVLDKLTSTMLGDQRIG